MLIINTFLDFLVKIILTEKIPLFQWNFNYKNYYFIIIIFF